MQFTYLQWPTIGIYSHVLSGSSRALATQKCGVRIKKYNLSDTFFKKRKSPAFVKLRSGGPVHEPTAIFFLFQILIAFITILSLHVAKPGNHRTQRGNYQNLSEQRLRGRLYLTTQPVAQLVEHRAVTREVVSSTPAGPTLRVFK